MSETVHNRKYEQLKEKYNKKYITKEILIGWVTLNTKKAGRGITEEEYKEITGEKVKNDAV